MKPRTDPCTHPLSSYGKGLLDTMDHAEKIRQLEALLADPAEANDPLTHFLLGREYMEAERLDDAASSFERVIQLNPHYTAAYRFWGDCHRLLGNKEKAREIYELGIGIANETGDLQPGKEMQVFLKKLG